MDDLGTNLNIRRGGANRSKVTATLTGVSGTTVRAQSRARTAENVVFETIDDVILSPKACLRKCRRWLTAPLRRRLASINIIVTLVPGWETVTNPVCC